MARIYYTVEDIERLAASGVRQLEVGPGVALTDMARETAEMMGIALVAPGTPVPAPVSPAPASVTASLPPRPRGCQHGPLAGSAPAAGASSSAPANGRTPAGGSSGMVNRLVDIVSQLSGRGDGS